MKTKFLILVSFCAFQFSFGQNPYYDAIKLKEYIKNGKFITDTTSINKVATILKPYLISPPLSVKKGNQILALFQQSGSPNYNPFIEPYIDLSGVTANLFQDLSKQISAEKLISGIGSLDISNVADGMAKFLVKRAKQELSIAFFEKFQEELYKYPDLMSVFPQTYRAFSVIGTEIYMFEAYIQTLRKSFEKDLASLPSNLPSILDNHKEYFNTMAELKAELLTAFYIAQSIQDKQHPGKIIENYPINYLDSVNLNIKASFQTLQLFSTSLRSYNDTTYWVSSLDIKKFINDEVLFKLYLGLVLQQAKKSSIKFKNKNGQLVYLADEMSKYYGRYKEYQPYIINLSTKTQTLETKIKGLKKVSKDSLLFENYYSIVSLSIELMRYAVQIDTLPMFAKDSLKLKEKTKLYFDLAQTSADIVIDVNRKNYSSAIVNGVYILHETFDSANIRIFIIKKYPKSSKKEKEDLYTEYLSISSKLFKYGSFMVAVARAESSDDVETAIEAIALPAGSARIKRESLWNISLNAYCGGFIGQDRIKFRSKPDYSYGLTAPIGIAVSYGGIFKHSSVSGFLSIIDLGAITAFRFKNDTTAVSKIKLKDIISPGIFLSYGVPKWPISFNAGCQLTPLLTSVSPAGSNTEARMFRFTMSICVDIPILNLYTQGK
jgi:hypothetical protein